MVEIERTRERCIFKTQNCYIIVPMSNQVKILLNIMDGINNNNPNADGIIKELPLLNDKVVVVPILDQGILNYLANPQATYSSESVNYFSKLITNIKGSLVNSQKQVDNVSIINDNSKFASFNNYFALNASTVSIQKSNGDLLIKNTPSNNMTNVMPNPNIMASDIPLAYPQGIEEEQGKGMVRELKPNHGEPGFVSYVLLGVVIAIMSLVFLYMLI